MSDGIWFTISGCSAIVTVIATFWALREDRPKRTATEIKGGQTIIVHMAPNDKIEITTKSRDDAPEEKT